MHGMSGDQKPGMSPAGLTAVVVAALFTLMVVVVIVAALR